MEIKAMKREHKGEVCAMMEVFYASEAVFTNGSAEIFENDIEACVGVCPFLDGYVFEENGEIAGYGMVAKSFSTEFGKPCFWIEDIYLKEKYRGRGFGSGFLEFVSQKYSGGIIRLEVEGDNEAALRTYAKNGFEKLPYLEMVKK